MTINGEQDLFLYQGRSNLSHMLESVY